MAERKPEQHTCDCCKQPTATAYEHFDFVSERGFNCLPTESEPERETIVGPAIMWPDRSFSWMPTPGSHYAVSEEMKRQTPHPSTTPLKWPQGFVTSEHRFVNRKVARQIAEAAGQIVNPITEGEDLFSEELWTPSPAPETRATTPWTWPDGTPRVFDGSKCQQQGYCSCSLADCSTTDDRVEWAAPETPSPEVGIEPEYECQVWQGDDLVANAFGVSLGEVEREAMHYAAQYRQDGPVDVKLSVRYRRAAAKEQSK